MHYLNCYLSQNYFLKFLLLSSFYQLRKQSHEKVKKQTYSRKQSLQEAQPLEFNII